MGDFYIWWIEKPQRLIDLGRGMFTAGAIFLIAGLWGIMATRSISIFALLAPSAQSQAVKTLADLYPALPTWWIPESAFGFIIVIILAVLGFFAAIAGKQYKRMLC